jgi:hypothetical protein
LPFGRRVLGLGQLHDVVSGIPQVRSCRPSASGIGSTNEADLLRRSPEAHAPSTEWPRSRRERISSACRWINGQHLKSVRVIAAMPYRYALDK